MAGFVLKQLDGKNKGLISNIQRNIRMLSFLGMKFDDKIIKQSKAVGVAESELDNMYGMYSAQGNYMGDDYGMKEFIAFYDKEYLSRREFIRRFVQNSEIEHVLDIIADEAIILDKNNFFAYPNTKELKNLLKADKAKEIVDDLNAAFKKVYFAFGFNESQDAWHYLKKFLTDGFLSFEIIYDVNEDNNAKNIIGFKEIDPTSLEPEMRKTEDGHDYRVWVQYRGNASKQRELVDANVIYISWARSNFLSRISYAERLVRSFNMLRTLENSRIIWNVWNSQYRMKLVVPIGSQSEVKARTRLAELRAMYKEDLTIDYHSGEITFNGQPNFSFFKTYIIPSKEGTQTEIDSFQPQGFDLNNTEQLKYFLMRFINDTKVPANRFRIDESGGGMWGASAEALQREELSFSYFINRIRSIFQEIILKPTWLQFCLTHPEFEKDKSLKGCIGLDYIEENLFKLIKLREVAEKAANTISSLYNLKQPTILPDGTLGEEAFFDIKFLVEKYMDIDENDTKLNEKYKAERKSQMLKLQSLYKRIQDAQGGGESSGGGGEMMGGLPTEGGGEEYSPEAGAEETPTGGGEEPLAPEV